MDTIYSIQYSFAKQVLDNHSRVHIVKINIVSETEKTFKVDRTTRGIYRDTIKKSEIDNEDGGEFFSTPEKAIQEARKKTAKRIQSVEENLHLLLCIREDLEKEISTQE